MILYQLSVCCVTRALKYLRSRKNKPNAFRCLIVEGDLQKYFGVCCCESFILLEVLESQNIFSRFVHEIMHCSPYVFLKTELHCSGWTCLCKMFNG
jgi:hypothetical protein